MGTEQRAVAGPGRPALLAKIRERIRAAGRISFADFMAMALYEPGLGYYAVPGEQIGLAGADYYTSPTLHPAFGEMLARQLREMADLLGDDPFSVVEMGAGKGVLARAILDAWPRVTPGGTRPPYVMIEKNAAMVTAQRARFKDSGHVLWTDGLDRLPELRGVSGCLLSNELVDAFPVHRVVVRDGRLQEVFVTEQGGALVEVLGEPSTPNLQVYFDRLKLKLPEGYQTEVNLEALRWMEAVGRAIRRGFVLTIDYGYPAEERYAPHRNRGTFLCYHRHTVAEDPYLRVGEQDMTSHVDFTSLAWAGREAGLEVTGFTDQTSFLLGLGLAQAIDARQAANVPPRDDEITEIAKMTALLDPRDIGRTYKVLIQHKGIPTPRLSGLAFRAFLPLALP